MDDLNFKPHKVPPHSEYRPEVAVKDGVEYHRKIGTDFIYKQGADCFTCLKCGSDIETSAVAHSVWDGLFPMSGSGRVINEQCPYCPKCEKRPGYHGTPIIE